MAGGYRHNPQGPEFLAKEIRDIEARLAQLQRALTGLGLNISGGTLNVPTGKSIKITGGGTVIVVDIDGHEVGRIGALTPDLNRTGGIPQPGVMFNREDGTLAALLGDANPTALPYKQAWQVFDRAGNVVMADDTNSGKGLAAPYVGGGVILGDTNTARWPQTTSSTFVSVMFGWYRIQNPKVQWDIQYVADAATAGQVEILINGTQVDTTQTVGTSFGLWTRYNVAIPGTWAVGDVVSVDIQARRSSGTGIVYVQALRFSGDQS